MISLDDALAHVKKHALLGEIERVEIRFCTGRILSESVMACHNQPPENVSAMDGYALREADLDIPLNVIGESRAGALFERSVEAGQAVRIFTGAHVPVGADRVIMQENASRDGDVLNITDTSGPRFIRPKGSDFETGQVIAEAGTLIQPAHIVSLAAAGHGTLPVRKRVRVGLLRGGDELVPAGRPLQTGQIVDANGPGLLALVERWGGEAVDMGIAPDDPAAIRQIIENFQDQFDIIVPVGGASVGDHDHMQSVFKALGFKAVFSKVAVKPGKPTWLSTRGAQRVLGLPGNPSSAWVCANIFLRALMDLPSHEEILPTETDLPAGGSRAEYMRAIAMNGTVQSLSKQDSGLTTTIARANALILRRANCEAALSGQPVSILRLNGL